ncbi:hypothetical protein IAE38_004387, partial [Pseudomonas sp. S32]|nr:hypothetical protein [Pseudomonas sp. S32]
NGTPPGGAGARRVLAGVLAAWGVGLAVSLAMGCAVMLTVGLAAVLRRR